MLLEIKGLNLQFLLKSEILMFRKVGGFVELWLKLELVVHTLHDLSQ